MPFVPALSLLRHAAPGPSMAATWLASLFGETPWAEARATLHANILPVFTPAKPHKDGHSPIPKDGVASTTWGTRRLIAWCDSSAVIADQTDAGWAVWPAVLYLATEVQEDGFKSVPYLERHTLPLLRLRPGPSGVYWEIHGGEPTHTQDADIAQALHAAADARVGEIAQAGPLADPRAHGTPTVGRFAPFSPFPPATTPHTEQTLRRILAAAARIGGADGFSCTRTLSPSPWRTPRTTRRTLYALTPTIYSKKPTKDWIQWLTTGVFGDTDTPGVLDPAFLLTAFPESHVYTGLASEFSSSAHGAIEARAVLLGAFGATHCAQMPEPRPQS